MFVATIKKLINPNCAFSQQPFFAAFIAVLALAIIIVVFTMKDHSPTIKSYRKKS